MTKQQVALVDIKRAEADLRIAEEKTKQDAEKTKQMQIELEMMKLKMKTPEPVPPLPKFNTNKLEYTQFYQEFPVKIKQFVSRYIRIDGREEAFSTRCLYQMLIHLDDLISEHIDYASFVLYLAHIGCCLNHYVNSETQTTDWYILGSTILETRDEFVDRYEMVERRRAAQTNGIQLTGHKLRQILWAASGQDALSEVSSEEDI